MLDKPLGQICLADIEELKDDKVSEGKTIDYKRDMYFLDRGKPEIRDKQIEEFLKDLSSFSNSIGGHLIIGVDEQGGIPTDIPGISISDVDALKNQLHLLAEKWLEPRASFEIGDILINGNPNRYVLVIRIPQSLISPHRVVYQGQFGQFYGRNSSGTFKMDTSNLRQAFTLSETIYDRIKKFHKSQVMQIQNHASPIPTEGNSYLILHLLPLESFSTHSVFDAETIRAAMTAYGSLIYNGNYNIDGYVLYEGHNENTRKNQMYIQAFRSGIIEQVWANVAHKPYGPENNNAHVLLYPECLEQKAVEYMRRHLQFFRQLGIHPPIWCFVTLAGVKGTLIWYSSITVMTDCCRPIDRDILEFPELRLDDLSVDPEPLFDPLIKMMWNAGGCPYSLNRR